MNRTFDVTCPRCHRTLPNIKIGINSYLEVSCTHCQKEYYVKSTNSGVRAALLDELKNK